MKVINSEMNILHKTCNDRGRNMIMRFSKLNILRLRQVGNVLDLGYLGVQNDFPTVKYVLSFRKKRKSGLSNEEKRHNRRKHSKLRVIVEHTLSRIKKFGIMGAKFRNRIKRYDNISRIAPALVNFRIMMRTNVMLL
jgi:hypothetical protein